MRYLLTLFVFISFFCWTFVEGKTLEWNEFEAKISKEKDFYKRLAIFQQKEKQIYELEEKVVKSKQGKLNDRVVAGEMALWAFTAQKVDLSTLTRTTCSERVEKVFSGLGIEKSDRSDFSQTVEKHFQILCTGLSKNVDQ